MNTQQLIEALRKTRPDVCVSIEWTPDPYYIWDGDGPDPETYGQTAHDVTARAVTIRNGRMVEGIDFLGGSYSPFGGPHCPDVHGYGCQMIEAAVADLDRQLIEAAA